MKAISRLVGLSRGIAGAAAWSLVSQGNSALSNVIISLAVARSTGAEGLGRFQIVFSAYLIALGFGRQLIFEPFVVASQKVRSERHLQTAALAFGTALGALAVAAGIILDIPGLIALGVGLPFLGLQDAARYAAFSRGRPRIAASLDSLWFFVSIVTAAIVLYNPMSNALVVVLWMAGGALGGIWSLCRNGAGPVPVVWHWWKLELQPHGLQLAAAGIWFTLGSQILMLLGAGLVGIAALGALKGGLVVFGAVPLIVSAISLLAISLISNEQYDDATRLLRLGLAVSAGFIGLILVTAGPIQYLLFAEKDFVTVPVLVILAFHMLMLSASAMATAEIRGRGLGRDLRQVYFRSYILTLPIAIPLLLLNSVSTFAAALTVQSVAVATLSFRKAKRFL